MSAAERLDPRSSETRTPVGPGIVLAEIALSVSVGKGALFAGLKAMGFTAVTVAFVKKGSEKKRAPTEPAEPAMRVRFLGRLSRAILPTDTAVITWTTFEQASVDPFKKLVDMTDLPVMPFVLERGALYEFRFVARVKALPNAEAVADALDDMGFDVRELIHLTHEEDHVGNLSVWFGRGVWDSPLSVVTPEDPGSFEQLVKVISSGCDS